MATELTTEAGMHITPETPGGPIAASPAPPPDDKPEAERERPRNPRDDMMVRIAERRAEAIAREVAYGRDMDPEAGDDEAPRPREEAGDPNEPPMAAPARDAEPQPTHAQPTHGQPAQPQLIPFDPGNGTVLYVTPEQLTGLAREAAQHRIALSQRAQQIANGYPQGAAPTGPAGSPSPGSPPGQSPNYAISPDRAEQIFRRITFGDPAEGSRALDDYGREILARAQQMSPHPDQIAQVATHRAIETLRMEHNLNTIGNEFPDVFNDRILSQVAALKVGELRQAYATYGRQVSDLELYRDACSAVRASTRSAPQPASEVRPEPQATASQAAQVASTAFAAKLERKRAAPSSPAAVGRVAGDDSAQPWAGDRSKIVDQMRRARGQPSMR